MRIEGTLYRICVWIYQLAYLNVLFVISCLPVITIFPAGAAMFGVVREWVNKREVPIFSTYRKIFKENFKQSFKLGIMIMLVSFMLLGDLYLLTKLKTVLTFFILAGVSLVGFYFMISVLYVFPLMVNSHYTFKELVKTSFKFGLYKFSFTAANLIVLGVWLYVSLKFSFFLAFFFFSTSAFVTYWLAGQKMMSLEREKQAPVRKRSASHIRLVK